MDKINDMLSEKEAKVFPKKDPVAFNISVQNGLTGETNSLTMPVLPANTLGQIMYACQGPDGIGIKPSKGKITFIHGRTQDSTTDVNKTVQEFGLKEGDILILNDEGQNA